MGFWLRDADDAAPVSQSLPPRGRTASAASYDAPRAITASAERITLQNAAYAGRGMLEWQRAAWVAYERVGEIHFGFNLLAGLLSRVRFYGAARGSANEPPTDVELKGRRPGVSKQLEEAVSTLVTELFMVDAPGMIRNAILNLCVPGECLLLQLPATATAPARWAIRSVDEVQVRGDSSAVVVANRQTGERVTLPPGTYIARIWRRHPRHSNEPDSSMLGVADAVEELLMLQRLVRSATRSRLNAGLLFVPDGVASAVNMKAMPEPAPDADPEDAFAALRAGNTGDPSGKFLGDLVETMTAPINDESSAATIVPMLVTGPGDEGAKIRHITFERSTDAWLADRIEKVLDRILQGIDMPKEIVTGMEQVKYSNAVVVDESMYKANIEPLALTLADAFTAIYLRPRLAGLGFKPEEIAKVVIWYDPSEIVTRPNSADEANEGYDRGALSGATWRREHGYAESDAPDEEERAMMLLSKAGALPESVILELLRKSFPNVLGDLPDPRSKPLGVGQAAQGPNVVQFPQGSQPPAQAPADPQRTAIKQVGVT